MSRCFECSEFERPVEEPRRVVARRQFGQISLSPKSHVLHGAIIAPSHGLAAHERIRR